MAIQSTMEMQLHQLDILVAEITRLSVLGCLHSVILILMMDGIGTLLLLQMNVKLSGTGIPIRLITQRVIQQAGSKRTIDMFMYVMNLKVTRILQVMCITSIMTELNIESRTMMEEQYLGLLIRYSLKLT